MWYNIYMVNKIAQKEKKEEYGEHRSNTIDHGDYWVCHKCHIPIPNDTKYEDEVWVKGHLYCTKKCAFLNALWGKL